MNKVFIVPGYLASPNDHWFPWLAEKIQSTGALAKIIQFTQPEQPIYTQWQQNLHEQIQDLDENSILIAHSLGCVTTLNFLSNILGSKSVKALICVAGFEEKLSSLPQLNEYIQQTHIDHALIQQHIQQRSVYFSNNDPLVPAALSLHLADLIQATPTEVKQAGHFMGQDGYIQFPQLWDQVKVLLNSKL